MRFTRFSSVRRWTWNCRRTVVAIIVAIGACSAPSFAQAPARPGEPAYDPASKSYFELVYDNGAIGFFGRSKYNGLWETAKKLAEERVYKGIHGRLAVIRTPETHFFLMKTFRISEVAWIGLRYWCRTHQLEWVDGEVQAPQDFQNWDPLWDHAIPGAGCRGTEPGERPFMPIAVGNVSYGFQWFAQGGNKGYSYYFVQYPTGEP